jgi:tRNA(Ile)-lysidine synthase
MHHDPARAVYRAARRSARAAGRPLLLAVSGGLDSMVLLRAMATAAREHVALAATFDHGTGPEAARAAAHVRGECERLGIPVVAGRAAAPIAAPEGREAAWREARYGFLSRAAREAGAVVATAHTEDDQLETVLMRTMRGSGARGLAGLYAGGPVVRPLLGMRRETLAAFARSEGVRWVEDPTNASREFARNRMRHDLLPALRAVAPAFEADLLDIARRAALLRRDVESFVASHLQPREERPGRVTVRRSALAGHDAEGLAMLWGALAGRAGLALDRRGTRRVAEFTIGEPREGIIQLSGGWCLEATPDVYIIERPAASSVPEAVRLPSDGSVEWGAFRFRVSRAGEAASPWTATIAGEAGAVVRAWSPGDRLEPAGGQRRRRVTRYLSDVGLRGRERAGWPVVLAGEDVVWIPGVRRSDAATDRSGRPARHYVCERIDR